MSGIIPLTVIFPYLGEEVNVILHDGTSYWRRVQGVSDGKLRLAFYEDTGNSLTEWDVTTVRQEDIRSFGTKKDGLLWERKLAS